MVREHATRCHRPFDISQDDGNDGAVYSGTFTLGKRASTLNDVDDRVGAIVYKCAVAVLVICLFQ